MATSPLPSQGPIGGRIGYITPAFSGSPIEGDNIRSGYITPEFLGTDSLVRGGKNGHGWGVVKKDAQLANTPPKLPR